MKRALALPLTLLGGALLASCASNSGDGSSRPQLPSGISVRFPAAPANAYLSLLTDADESVYQLAVPAGSTSIAVDSSKWAAQSAKAKPILDFLPENAGPAGISVADVKANLLHWVMWQDKNTNGKRDTGETLDLMTHDRVAYASQAVEVKFSTPNMTQVWKLNEGWSRAEHYVYLPKGSSTYQRTLSSAGLQRYDLHVSTPVTSQ